MDESQIKLNDYGIRVHDHPGEIPAADWDALLASQDCPSPFMKHAYLLAMHASGSALPRTGWRAQFFSLWLGEQLVAACPLYLKTHSYGEYVFDWAWANAYAQHGLDYYPKALIAVPFTPVPGSRLLAHSDAHRDMLLQAVVSWCGQDKVSSLHLLFGSEADIQAANRAGLLQRQTVQFHWQNHGWQDFEAFLSSMTQEKRKKIRQERRKVAQAGVQFRHAKGTDISAADWDFFYQCYERTYLEHGNAPYLNREFFHHMAMALPEHWLLFVAQRQGRPIASSLIALNPGSSVAYGRYWGALERVDCLHFEACYYQPLQWCIEQNYCRFEGGAQGEHKLARALLPVKASSAHWLAHPAFSDAVANFLEREGDGIGEYLEDLKQRSPLRKLPAP